MPEATIGGGGEAGSWEVSDGHVGAERHHVVPSQQRKGASAEPEPPGASASRSRSVHTVDWAMLLAIRKVLYRRSIIAAAAAKAATDACLSPSHGATQAREAEAAVEAAHGAPKAAVQSECEWATTAEELVECWVEASEAEQRRHGGAPLTNRDREFIDIRVSQSVREVDKQCTGQVDADCWVHHMLLTRSSPPAMRAMLQVNRLLECALHGCPAILVTLQHAFEVARERVAQASPPSAAADRAGARRPSLTVGSDVTLPFSEVVSIYARKLWHLRPGTRDCPAKRRTDFSFRTPEDFVRSIVKAMDLEPDSRVSSADFLALCLGRKEWEVTLHLYDLSKGVATALSPWLLDERLEGVWHTGLVVYGKEYYFGGDIYYDTPGETGFGRPRVFISLGSTLRQRDELHAFVVDELKPIFTREAYDAARNNCNHFTDRVAMYLVGRHIPEEVLKQPDILIKTNLGRALRPVLTRMLGQYFEPKNTAEEIPAAAVFALEQAQKASKAGGQPAADNRCYDTTFAL